MSKVIYLTKSRYVAGLQCLRRLWLNVHEPLERQEPEPGTALDVGIEVGRMARLLFPGGVLVAQEPWEHAAAVSRTAELMADRICTGDFRGRVRIFGGPHQGRCA